MKKKDDSKMSIQNGNPEKTGLDKIREATPTVNIPFLFYELISFQDDSKAIGSMPLEDKDFELVKQQIRSRKDKIIFDIKDSDWPMSLNTDKYSRVWVEIVAERVVGGDANSMIIDPKTGLPAKIEQKLDLKN